jgi:calcium-dependent protein kinase
MTNKPNNNTERKYKDKLLSPQKSPRKKILNLPIKKSHRNSQVLTNPLNINQQSPLSKRKKKESKIQITKSLFIQYKEGLIEKDYDILETVGSGAFATVKKVVHKLTNQTRALKIIKKSEEEDQKNLIREVNILSKLVHPNIMQIFEYYEDETFFYIITEYCAGGELFNELIKKGSFKEIEASFIMKQIFSAVSYIHSNNIVHRDLKPENILLDTEEGKNIIKIIDWGTARYFDKNKKMNRISGTPYYIAPEVIMGNYDEKCDIWSCGVIMYILLCGYAPFNGETDEKIFEKIKLGKYTFPKKEWDYVSSEAKDLIKHLLEYNPKKRYSANDVLKHHWMIKGNINVKIDKSFVLHSLVNMKKFHAERKLQQAALTYIVNNLVSKKEKNKLLEVFQSFDTNKDGVLSKKEILNGYKKIMPFEDATKEVEKIMNTVDIDGNGTIDYNEFVLATINKTKLLDKEKLEQTFKLFDKDGNGFISKEEIEEVLGTSVIDSKELDKMIKEVDKNGDGQISLVEFKEMMVKLI